MKKQLKCYIYTRVSTAMQVEGYSLDAQKDKLKKYADYQEMVIAGEYSDEGKSGKSVEGRPEFQQMLQDIESGKDNVDFVLVFKLSRFGRNAADVLNSLQRMQDFGVNLICVEDGIDSSKDAGKLMISVLSAVAEIERENILVQTMEGRRQKAREGKWNGGFAPYGYKLVDGELHIAEDEAPIICLIYDKFVNTTMGIGAIAVFLNQNGYHKKIRQNNTMETFSSSFIKGVLDNPIYCGKLAFGRRKNEKIAGTRNEYHVVKQDSYLISDGIHDEIISEEDWDLAQKKRQETGVGNEKVHSLEHEHILSGIVKCPICGSGMYGNVNRKKRKDGTLYKDYFYYACKHRTFIDGHHCTYRKQWNQDRVNDAVAEIIGKLVNNPKFENEIRTKIGNSLDTKDLEIEHTNLKEQLKQLQGAKNKLASQMDHLSVSDKHYDKKYQDMQERMDGLYDEMDAMELSIEEVENRLFNIKQQKISGDNVYQFLLYFDKLYDKMTDGEKKEFVKSFVEEVHLYEKEQEDGRFLKHIKFKFPVFFNGTETRELDWDNESTVETVKVHYNPDIITLPFLLDLFYDAIDPTSVNRQGGDHGSQYRTAIYYTQEADAVIIDESIANLQKNYDRKIAVQVQPLDNFYPAEDYHQKYLDKNPNGYCHIGREKFESASRAIVNPVNYPLPDPTILKEQLSETQYKVTQQGDTEPPFQNELWNHFVSGIYVDITTGEPLFSSTDKFESGCGWPSFSRPIDPNVIKEKEDTSFGRVRTEVRSRAGGAHLGHVFEDGPKDAGGQRYCINSASLRFIPKDQMEREGYGYLIHLVK